MKIAQIAPCWYEVPPKGYGGIEHVVANLTDSLVSMGHEVHLISAGMQGTRAIGHQTFSDPPTGHIGETLPELLHRAKAQVLLREIDVDVVHDHTLSGTVFTDELPTLTTVHGTSIGNEGEYLGLTARRPLVAISHRQKQLNPLLPWIGVAHNGLDFNSFKVPARKEDFALFLGRMSPDKGPDLAITAARRAKLPLLLAAKCNEQREQDYFNSEIRPMLGENETWLGEVDQIRRNQLLEDASVLLLPLRWEEPFGMVLIEAMACGTPVVAIRRGATEELIEDGLTGCLVDHIDDFPEAIARSRSLDPRVVRSRTESRFSSDVMARTYLGYYERI